MDFTIDEFNKIAINALQDAQTDFGQGQVAKRLSEKHVIQLVGPETKINSLKLRQDLAQALNSKYADGGGVTVPSSVLKALKVDEYFSGFRKLPNGTIVATDHPLTTRRLVCIMSAVRLERSENLETVVSMLEGKTGSASFMQFVPFLKQNISRLHGMVSAAAKATVEPQTLQFLLPNLKNAVQRIEDSYSALDQADIAEDERELLRHLINEAVDIANDFGAEVEKLPAPPLPPIPEIFNEPVVEAVNLQVVNAPKDPTGDELLADYKATVRQEFVNRLSLPPGWDGEITNLVPWPKPDDLRERFQAGEDLNQCARVLSNRIAARITRVMDLDLDDSDKLELIKQLVMENRDLGEGEGEDAVKKYRQRVYSQFATEWKNSFVADVAQQVVSLLKQLDDPSCKAGLENLKKDFHDPKHFTQWIKATRHLSCFDLTNSSTVADFLQGKLDTSAFDQINVDLDLAAFKASHDEKINSAATLLVERLKQVLSADLFEDDRTKLAEKAFDPNAEPEFVEDLRNATKRYEEKVLDRIMLAQMPGRIAAAKMKTHVREAEATVSSAFRELYGPEAQTEKKEVGQVRPKDDFDVGSDAGRPMSVEQMWGAVRTLFADFFSAKGKKPHALLMEHAATLQAMLLDPALVETTAIPGEGKGGDAVREAVRNLLGKISDDVNGGQLTPKDFKEVLKDLLDKDLDTVTNEPKKDGLLSQFANSLQVAGRAVLGDLQARFTRELTDVLRHLTGQNVNLGISKQTLAELGASGLGSFETGYGKFLAFVLDNYFTHETLAAEDHDRMLESLFRNGKTGGTSGDAFGALIKGAGPIFQKVLQSIPLEGLPEEIVKALTDVKSGLAPIDRTVIERRLQDAVNKQQKENENNNARVSKAEVVRSLGAASVGQAVLCNVYVENAEKPRQVVVKFLRPGVKEIASRERKFFKVMAEKVDSAMEKTFAARMDGIFEELDFNNEKKWINEGQCYGERDNYKGVSVISDMSLGLDFDSMNVSNVLPSDSDMLVLDVAEGEPLDRCNRKTRQELEAEVRRLTKVVDGKKGLYADSGFHLIDVNRRLVMMYDDLARRRTLIEELVRRFGAELFKRGLFGKTKEGGFMHGDLHGGNLMVTANTMTVIDFGNSHKYSGEERQWLVRFVASCIFSMGECALEAIDNLLLLANKEQLGKTGKALAKDDKNKNTGIKNRSDYQTLKADVNEILKKGDANDVTSRGMAVVQYLQRKGVQMPGPIVDFTETVMRLTAAYEETDKLMSDVAETVGALKLNPAADTKLDPYSKYADSLFTHRIKDRLSSVEAKNLDKSFNAGLARMNGVEPLTADDYRDVVLPYMKLFENCRRPCNNLKGKPLGLAVREIRQKFELLGQKAFATKDEKGNLSAMDPRVSQLLANLNYIINVAYANAPTESLPQFLLNAREGDGINNCMAAGIFSLDLGDLLSLFTGHGVSTIIMDKDKVAAVAQQTLLRREIARDAQALLQRERGGIDEKARRFADRFAKDHFIWSKGDPQTMFAVKQVLLGDGRNQWWNDKNQVAAVEEVLKLNLKKLHEGAKVAGITCDERLENHALMPFVIHHGLVDSLHSMSEAEFGLLSNKVKDSSVREKLLFFRTDPSVRQAIGFGRSVAHAQKEATKFDFNGLLQIKAFVKSRFNPLPKQKGTLLPSDTIRALVAFRSALYDEVLEKYKNGSKDITDCGMMSYLLDQGLLQELKKMDESARKVELQRIATLSKDKGTDNKLRQSCRDLGDMLNRLLKYMS